ncbi:hypothetical protein IWX81_000255 [Salinibacterium sp. CAN_S4]|uniref:hypothetical protein n=1 Tax=Salinibacterium sp. CAN_S4 TaxID=2787727 RepID=UPI0018F058AB
MSRRRVTIELRRPRLRLHFGIRPTVVVDGITQPTQWGVGTWQVDADRETPMDVFLYIAGVTFGRASTTIGERGATYRAPRLPFRPGRFLA